MSSGPAYEPGGTSVIGRGARTYTIRRWSVRHARFLEIVYNFFADILLGLHPLWNTIGYERVERPIVAIESRVKGFLFDCRMCGKCVLSSTGMSCPMNCPKSLRNGPCGGVRANGNCEVEPDMPCVWTEAWKGSRMMKNGSDINIVQMPPDQSLRGTSSWLRATAEQAEAKNAAKSHD